MRRPAVAVIVALVLSALGAGSAMAVPFVPGTLDQSASGGSNIFGTGQPITQTFTAGKTGFITHVAVYCDPSLPAPAVAGPNGDAVLITVTISGSSASDSEGCYGGIANFLYGPVMPMVNAGEQYTMTVSSTDPFSLGAADDPYAGGAAARGGSPIEGVSDIAFWTYVYAPPETSYTWNPTHVIAGASSTVSLTTATTFYVSAGAYPDVVPNAFDTPSTVKLTALPSWFSPTGITCSAPIPAAACTLANFKAGIVVPVNPALDTVVTIVVTGTATPAAGDVGGSGQANGEGCFAYPLIDSDPLNMCGDAGAELAIVALATPTPAPTATATATATPTAASTTTLPPTTTSGRPGSGGFELWLLLASIAASLGLAFTARRHYSRRF